MPPEVINHEEEEFIVTPESFGERTETLSREEYEQEVPGPHQEPAEMDDTLERSEPIDPGKQIVLDHKGVGEADNWGLYSKGESGRTFNGTEIFDAEGNSWTKEIELHGQPDDIALHHEMLAQWREGGGDVFFLPDHIERTEDGETLYVTFLKLDETGSVSYEIWAYETKYDKEDAAPVLSVEGYNDTPDASLPVEIVTDPQDVRGAFELFNELPLAEQTQGVVTVGGEQEVAPSETILIPEVGEASAEAVMNTLVPETPAVSVESGDSLSVLLKELFSIDLLRSTDLEPEEAVNRMDSKELVSNEPILIAQEDVEVAINEWKSGMVASTQGHPESVAPSSDKTLEPAVAFDVIRAIEPESLIRTPNIVELAQETIVDFVADLPDLSHDVSPGLHSISVETPTDAVSWRTPADEKTYVVADHSRTDEVKIDAGLTDVRQEIIASLIRPEQAELKALRQDRHESSILQRESRYVPSLILGNNIVREVRGGSAVEVPRDVAERTTEHPPLSTNVSLFTDSSKTERGIPFHGTEVLLRALGTRVPATPHLSGDIHTMVSPEVLRTSNTASSQSIPVSDVLPFGETGHILHGVRMRHAV